VSAKVAATSRFEPKTTLPGLATRTLSTASTPAAYLNRAAASHEPTSSHPAFSGTTETFRARSITA
jgi:hypothetical protein